MRKNNHKKFFDCLDLTLTMYDKCLKENNSIELNMLRSAPKKKGELIKFYIKKCEIWHSWLVHFEEGEHYEVCAKIMKALEFEDYCLRQAFQEEYGDVKKGDEEMIKQANIKYKLPKSMEEESDND
jgi:hypothetical protein